MDEMLTTLNEVKGLLEAQKDDDSDEGDATDEELVLKCKSTRN